MARHPLPGGRNAAVEIRVSALSGFASIQKDEPYPTSAQDLPYRTVVHRIRIALLILKDQNPLSSLASYSPWPMKCNTEKTPRGDIAMQRSRGRRASTSHPPKPASRRRLEASPDHRFLFFNGQLSEPTGCDETTRMAAAAGRR